MQAKKDVMVKQARTVDLVRQEMVRKLYFLWLSDWSKFFLRLKTTQAPMAELV